MNLDAKDTHARMHVNGLAHVYDSQVDANVNLYLMSGGELNRSHPWVRVTNGVLEVNNH